MTLGTSTRGQKGHSQHKLLITKDEFIKWYNNQTKTCAYCGLSIDEYLKIIDQMKNQGFSAVSFTLGVFQKKIWN